MDTMNDETILLPCPFCGGEAETRTSTWNDKNYKWTVQCKTNLCMGEMGCAFYRTEAEAIEAWNTRAERTCMIVEKQEEWQYNFGVKDYEFSCGHVISWAHTYDPKYCPVCGAKVVGE